MKFTIDYYGELQVITASSLKKAYEWAKRLHYRNVRSITDELGVEFPFFELVNL